MTNASDRRPRAPRSAPAVKGTASNRTMLVPRDLPVLFQMPDVSRERARPEPKPEPPPIQESQPALEIARPEVSLIVTAAPRETAVAPPIVPLPESPPVEAVAETKVAAPAKVERKPERAVQSAAGKGAWFDGQGKLITVCFLIALIATIYFARAGRDSGSAAQQTAWEETHPGDAAGRGGTPPPAPIAAESPTLTAVPPGQDLPKVELLPPIENFPAPTLAAEPQPTPAEPTPTPAEEPRTASLPPPVTAPPPSTEPPPARSGGGYGAPPPAYPGYPTTNPNNFPPHTFGPPAGASAPRGGYMPNYSPNPTAPSTPSTGAGYERTGSGVY